MKQFDNTDIDCVCPTKFPTKYLNIAISEKCKQNLKIVCKQQYIKGTRIKYIIVHIDVKFSHVCSLDSLNFRKMAYALVYILNDMQPLLRYIKRIMAAKIND